MISQLSKAALGERDGHLSIRLEDGTLSVLNKSVKPISIDARGALVQAEAGQASVYDVILNGNSLRVISRGGLVRVETANKSAELQPGNELDATLAPPPDPAHPPQSPTGTSLASTWVILTVAAVGVTGIILGAVALHKVDSCKLLSPNIVC
ncbi:MAG TPA: hypothetical protein VGT24_12880 [Candidatus Acidoferrales bacterium]|nr:hypothetical protein [Candidatus Acidoferrales bacterium]